LVTVTVKLTLCRNSSVPAGWPGSLGEMVADPTLVLVLAHVVQFTVWVTPDEVLPACVVSPEPGT
jgi:hypothetical protein